MKGFSWPFSMNNDMMNSRIPPVKFAKEVSIIGDTRFRFRATIMFVDPPTRLLVIKQKMPM